MDENEPQLEPTGNSAGCIHEALKFAALAASIIGSAYVVIDSLAHIDQIPVPEICGAKLLVVAASAAVFWWVIFVDSADSDLYD